MSTLPTVPRPPAAQTITLTMSAMLLTVPLITFVLWFVLAPDGVGHLPASWTFLVPLALAVGAYSYCELLGFRAKPLPPGGKAVEIESQSWMAFYQSTIIRFALCEAVFMTTIPISFIAASFWPVLFGAVLTLPLLGWECWPGLRNQQRFAASLEASGHPSFLTGRPVDRL